MYIEKINSPKDIKELSVEQLSVLAEEVRTALIRKLSEHGGHIGRILVWWKLQLHCIMFLTLPLIK